MKKEYKIALGLAAVSVFATIGYIVWRKRFVIRNSLTSLFTSNDTDMKLTLHRTIKNNSCTIGELSINGQFFCYTLEDKDRGLNSAMSADTIKKIKVAGETAIPTGTYEIDMNTISPKYSARGANSTYAKIDFKVPRLKNVTGFDGILMHIGNYPKDTDGCILVGTSIASNQNAINNSTEAFWALDSRLREAANKGHRITITII